MELECSSKISVTIYQNMWRYISEDSNIFSYRHENLKSLTGHVHSMALSFPLTDWGSLDYS
jgi:hypothetical protein